MRLPVLRARRIRAAGGRNGRFGVAHDRMGRPVALHGQLAALGEAIFILRVEGGAARDRVQDALDALVVLDQQLAGGGAHENLHAAHARHPLHYGKQVRVVVGRAGVEGVVRVHAAFCARELVFHHFRRGRRRIGVRHLEHGRNAAERRRARTAFEIFLPFEARLTEVDLAVDHAGKDMEAVRFEHLAGLAGVERPDGGDLPIFHSHITDGDPARRCNRSALDDQVVCRHWPAPAILRLS